jgi:hypothetical protein
MKRFRNWFLLERVLDRPFRDAAMRSYDRVKKVLMKTLEDALYDSVDAALARRRERGPEDERDPRALTADFTARIGSTSRGLDALVSANFYDTDITVYFKMSEKFLVLPPQISMADFNRVFPKTQEITKFVLQMTSDSGHGMGGMYTTGRVEKAFLTGVPLRTPRIFLYNNHALSFHHIDGGLHKLFQTISSTLADEKVDKNKLKKAVDNWLKEFDRSLEIHKYTYVHEYIHMLDDIRYKSELGSKDAQFPGNIKSGVESSGEVAYYKSDAEFNAWFQASAANIEDAVRAFLVASTSDFAGMNAAMRFKGFDALPRADKCVRVSAYVVEDLYRVIGDNLKEAWMTVGPTDLGLQSSGSPLYRLALGAVTWYARELSKHFLSDPKRRMKLLNRIYSLSQDLEAVVAEYKSSMAAGKVPSPQQFSAARTKFKPYGDSTKSWNAYSLFYSGSMMGKLKVFSPNKYYEQ